MTDAAFRREQRGVGIRMAVALAVSVVAIGLAWKSGPITTLGDRLAIVCVTVPATLAWFVAGIANVARIRFFSPGDIAGGGKTEGSVRIRNAAAILQNTLEQVVLAIPVQVAVAMTIERSWAVLIAMAVLFAVGRALFWRGHAHGAAARALGFALTFYPNVAALVVVLIAAIVRS